MAVHARRFPILGRRGILRAALAAVILAAAAGAQAQTVFHTLMSPPSLPPIATSEERELAAAESRGPYAGFPVTITAVALAARGGVAVDTTRLSPKAGDYFLPAAIPARNEAYFGSGERATVVGSGNSVGLGWLADLGTDSPLSGAVRLTSQIEGQSNFTITAPQAYMQWRYVTFGVTDSTFTDMDCIPETVDLNGPNARPWFRGGQPLIRFKYLRHDETTSDGSGFSGDVGVEAPGADVYTPAVKPGQPAYATFSRVPDLVASLQYQRGEMGENSCTHAKEWIEYWHLRAAATVRDLGVERSDDLVREHTTGWGVQLSGRYTIFRGAEPCDGLRDYVFCCVSGGDGIAHYFNDLRLVSPVNDAVYDGHTLSALPLLGGFAGYQHDWLENWRSTVLFSHLELNTANPNLPYRRGDYLSLNLMYHKELCVDGDPDPNKVKMVIRNFFTGVEYLFGQKENGAGDWGADHRVMFVIAATK